MTAHENNLRRNEFEQLFHSAGLDGVWSSLEGIPSVAAYIKEEDKTLEQMILDLVIFRNEAAHGNPDEILGIDTLRNWVSFINIFCEALAEFITYRVVTEEKKHKPESVLGKVTETFRDNIVVAKCNSGTLNVGDRLYFLRASDCTCAQIDSLQVENESRTSVTIQHEGVEIGIKTSIQVPKNAILVKITLH